MNQKLNQWLKGGIAICLSLFLFFCAGAQDFQLKGRVTDAATKSPVAAATIVSKNTSKGSTTDGAGNFSILTKNGDVLTVSYIGYGDVVVKVTGNTFLEIQISASTINLNEVVVTALGIRKETKRLGYSVQEVKTADLLKARESNPINSLVGKVAGLNVGINQELLA